MKKEIAGLPLYVWIVVTVVGAGLYGYYHAQKHGLLVNPFAKDASYLGPPDEPTPHTDDLAGLQSVGQPLQDTVFASPHIQLENDIRHERTIIGNADHLLPIPPNYNTYREAL